MARKAIRLANFIHANNVVMVRQIIEEATSKDERDLLKSILQMAAINLELSQEMSDLIDELTKEEDEQEKEDAA